MRAASLGRVMGEDLRVALRRVTRRSLRSMRAISASEKWGNFGHTQRCPFHVFRFRQGVAHFAYRGIGIGAVISGTFVDVVESGFGRSFKAASRSFRSRIFSNKLASAIKNSLQKGQKTKQPAQSGLKMKTISLWNSFCC